MTTPPLTLSHTVGPSEPEILDMTFGDVLRRAARECPDRVAVVSSSTGASWTYRELLDDAEALARTLVERFEAGARIAIWGQNVPEWTVVNHAVAIAGMVIVTVNPNLLPDEAAYVFDQSGATGVFAARAYRGRDLAAVAGELMHRCAELRDVVGFDDVAALTESGRRSVAALPTPDPGDLVMIQYTSGTTGFPKGASLHHRGLVTNAMHTSNRNQTQPGDVMLGVMPLFHTGGVVLGLMASAACFLTYVAIEEFDPGHVLDTIERFKVNVGTGVPTMLIAMMEHPTFSERDLSSIRVITSGGSTVPAPLVQRLESELGAPFTIVFGQTEMSPVATMTYPTDSTEDKANTLGRAMPHVEIKIIDADGNTVPIGEPGEFCSRGYSNMLGYNDNPDATAETIDADGWLHSGDICSMDERGYCYIVGRLKDMIIRGGENIYPREIEEVLFRHPSVAEIAVIGLPDDKWGEIVGAVVRPTPGTAPAVAELQDWVRQHLSRHKTPVAWFNTDTFPLTGSGKIQKFRLVEMWQAGELSPLS
jgi:fatty-acyl-CoA synthase